MLCAKQLWNSKVLRITNKISYSSCTILNNKYDCVVIGLGAMGSSTIYHLAKQNVKVLGLEQFKVGNSLGSSHGLTRIIRLAYYENPAYVDLLKRSFVLWDQLELESNKKLFFRTGTLDIGTQDSTTFYGSKMSCKVHNLEHSVLNRSQLIERFKGWESIPEIDDLYAIYQPDGGILNPEECVTGHVEMAKKYGAQVNEEESVLDVVIYGKDEVLVKTNKCEYLTSKIVLSPGAWLGGFIEKSESLSKIDKLKSIAKNLYPQRNVVIWYKSSKPEHYQANNFPVFILEHQKDFYYGFPIIKNEKYSFSNEGFKVGYTGRIQHTEKNLKNDNLDKNAKWRTEFTNEDQRPLDRIVQRLLKNAHGPIIHQQACMFTNIPDNNFIIDITPDSAYPCVTLVSACSGHGFKFSSVIGEIIANGVINQSQKGYKYPYGEVDWLRADRFFSIK